MGCVEEEIAEEMSERDPESAQDLGQVELLPKGQLAPADNFYPIYDAFPKNTSTTAVTTTLTTEIGNRPFHPKLMSWS